MAGMREIRERIASVSEIMKITNAMYLISSSNLKKAKKRLENTEPYFEKLQSTIHHILLHTPEFEHKYFDQREEKKPEDKMIGYIVVTADKGLAGAYNHNVLKLAEPCKGTQRRWSRSFLKNNVFRSVPQRKGRCSCA